MIIKKHFRLFIKLKGILLFFIFSFLPVICTLLLVYFIKSYFQIKPDNIVIVLLQYVFFMLPFLVLSKSRFHCNYYFAVGNQIKIFFNSLKIAFIAFIVSSFITVLFITLTLEVLVLPDFIRNWINSSNQGYLEIFEQINEKAYFKLFIWVVIIVVVTPIIEEILFRGFLQESAFKLLSRTIGCKFSKNFDVWFVAVVFGIFHFVSLPNIIFAFIVGLFLSYQRKKTGKINSSIYMHCVINFLGLGYGVIFEYIVK